MNILKRAIVTEKANKEAEKSIYGFIVDRDANKIDIKNAVQQMFGVTVEDVRTMRYLGKKSTRQTKRSVQTGRKSSFKKAIVCLKKGETIDFYGNI